MLAASERVESRTAQSTRLTHDQQQKRPERMALLFGVQSSERECW